MIDSTPAALMVAAGFALGVFDSDIFQPPADWFWSEWVFKFWLDERAVILVPLATWIVLSIVWTSVWEAVGARSLGGRILGLLVVDRSGLRIGSLPAFRRALGAALNVATLGLGYGWILTSSYRRGWHDWLSGTVVVRDGVGE
jgi:uncharacterized RDD family membrane protein YckC